MTIVHTTGTIPGKAGSENAIAILQGDTGLSKWIEQEHRLDADLNNVHILALPFIPRGGVVVDAGAFLGDHTAFYAQKASIVHAFEPLPESFECLRQNCSHLKNVILYNLALSNNEGEACIDVLRDNVGGSWIAPNGTPVRTTTLDQLNLSPDFIKWDIEGHEVLGLRGARETIMRKRPTMVLEVHQRGLGFAGFSIRDLLDELQRLGYYNCRDIRTGQSFNPYDGKQEYDIVCEP
jgi:FkbM family methyltransferase